MALIKGMIDDQDRKEGKVSSLVNNVMTDEIDSMFITCGPGQ